MVKLNQKIEITFLSDFAARSRPEQTKASRAKLLNRFPMFC